MKSTSIAVFAFIGLAAAGPVLAQESLAQSSGCLTCHAIDTKKVGPAFKDTAAKYKGKADAATVLSAKLSEGKGHPPVKASPDDVKKLVSWVLSL